MEVEWGCDRCRTAGSHAHTHLVVNSSRGLIYIESLERFRCAGGHRHPNSYFLSFSLVAKTTHQNELTCQNRRPTKGQTSRSQMLTLHSRDPPPPKCLCLYVTNRHQPVQFQGEHICDLSLSQREGESEPGLSQQAAVTLK